MISKERAGAAHEDLYATFSVGVCSCAWNHPKFMSAEGLFILLVQIYCKAVLWRRLALEAVVFGCRNLGWAAAWRSGLPLWPSFSGAGCLRCSAPPQCGSKWSQQFWGQPLKLWATEACIAGWVLSESLLPDFQCLAEWPCVHVTMASTGPLLVAPGISCHWPFWPHPDYRILGLLSIFGGAGPSSGRSWLRSHAKVWLGVGRTRCSPHVRGTEKQPPVQNCLSTLILSN